MKYSAIPTKFNIAFGSSAGAGFIRTIPQTSQVGIHDGWASLETGFPPLNFLALGAGGVPPFGQDMNGILNEITAWTRWQNAGGLTEFDSAFSTAIGGYPQGAIIASATMQGFWLCLADDNTQNPDTSTNPFQQGWMFFGAAGRTPLLANVVFYVNASTGSDSYDGSSATHTSGNIGPFLTLQHALNVVGQFLPGTFGATINLAAGTYDQGGSIATTASWAHCAVTITGPAIGTCLVTGHSSSGGVFSVAAVGVPYTLSGFSISYTGGATNSVCIDGNGQTVLNNVQFNGASGAASRFAVGCVIENITINGNAGGPLLNAIGGTGIGFTSAIVNAGNQAWSYSAFVEADSQGSVSVVGSTTFNGCGSLVGKRYNATLLSLINTGGGGPTYFPGNAAGTTDPSSVYA